jgi:uncharacterized protein YecA (UPF0149 family)
MSLYETWLRKAYDKTAKPVKAFWNGYLPKEQAVYEYLLGNKINMVKANVDTFAKEHKLEVYEACGFIDGINGALDTEVDVENLEETTELAISFTFENLYKKMVEYKAQHLYELKEWDLIFTPEQKKGLFVTQKTSGTVVKDKKPGRNDPCPCGSGKKYKKCCGLNEDAV